MLRPRATALTSDIALICLIREIDYIMQEMHMRARRDIGYEREQQVEMTEVAVQDLLAFLFIRSLSITRHGLRHLIR